MDKYGTVWIKEMDHNKLLRPLVSTEPLTVLCVYLTDGQVH